MWRSAQEGARDEHWPRVERLLADLPPGLARLTKLLEYDLGLAASDTGQFRDCFLGVDRFPVLSIGPWLFDDLGASVRSGGHVSTEAEGRLFVASLLMAFGVHLGERIGDDASFVGDDHVVLMQALAERAALELAAAVPPGSWFHRALPSLSVNGFETDLERRSIRDPAALDDRDALLHGRWVRSSRITAAAAIALAGREDGEAFFARVAHVIDDATTAFQILDDVGSFHRDLEAGRLTWPISVVAEASRVALRPWPQATLMLGALVVSSSVETILAAALRHLRVARQRANELGLGRFEAFLADAGARVEERLPSTNEKQATDGLSRARTPAGPLIIRHDPPLDRALSMAEGFLLADPTFRESWETHREGMLGAPFVASRFPAGLVLEILAAHGHDVGTLVDTFIRDSVADQFRYFDHPDSGSDTDTLGVVLRLLPHAADRPAAEAAVEPGLHRVDAAIHAAGRVPVWLPDLGPASRPVLDLGEHCGTVAAHLLLGLLHDRHAAHRDAAMLGANHLLARIVQVGLGANVNYPPIYALDIFLRLIGRLGPDTGRLGPDTVRLQEAHSRLHEALERAVRLRRPSPQDAALLIRACHAADRRDLVAPAWTTAILRAQRFDGGWGAEPFAAAPNRGRSVTWYASTTLTSALCFDALSPTRAQPLVPAGRDVATGHPVAR